MTSMYVAYTPTGRELDAQEEAEALGIWAIAPRRVDMIRTGTNRRAEPCVSAYLPNYLFLRLDAEQWHWLRDSKYCRTMRNIPKGEERLVMQFADAVEAEFSAKMAEVERAMAVMAQADATKDARRAALEALAQFREGQHIEILGGGLAGMLARFKAIAEGAGGRPEIVAEVELFGRETTLRLDPLDVRKAV